MREVIGIASVLVVPVLLVAFCREYRRSSPPNLNHWRRGVAVVFFVWVTSFWALLVFPWMFRLRKTPNADVIHAVPKEMYWICMTGAFLLCIALRGKLRSYGLLVILSIGIMLRSATYSP